MDPRATCNLLRDYGGCSTCLQSKFNTNGSIRKGGALRLDTKYCFSATWESKKKRRKIGVGRSRQQLEPFVRTAVPICYWTDSQFLQTVRNERDIIA
jgi:hypothetical protein